MNSLKELCIMARTCRRYRADVRLSEEELEDLVDTARCCPSARNAQVLRFATVCSPGAVRAVGAAVVLGAALKPGQRPRPDQMPAAYIVICAPENAGPFVLMDAGIAAQAMNLAAAEKGLACCMIGAFNAAAVRDAVRIPAGLEPRLVLAFGAPAEERRIAPLPPDGSTTYWRDEHDVHRVPKLSAAGLIASRN